jgi:hypothetical protein
MASISDNDKFSIQQLAEQHVTEILARRRADQATRAAALSAHSSPLTVKTEISAMRLTSALLTPVLSTGSASTAGYLLAIGDSWFDYPIRDVLTNLDTHYGYDIESAAHKGDSIEFGMSHVGQLDKFARLVDKLVGVGAVPKAILVSFGGDDIAGAEFGMLVNDFDLPASGWNEQIITGVIDGRIANAYRLLFTKVNALCQNGDLKNTFPILAHGYDYPVPDGRGFLGGWGALPGPWLKPGFDEKLFSDLSQTSQLMTVLIDRFNAMLLSVTREPGFENVHYIDLRGTLSNNLASDSYRKWWANELHPTGGNPLDPGDNGFAAVAAKFQAVLASLA